MVQEEAFALAVARRTLEEAAKLPVEEEQLERGDLHSIDALLRLGGERFAVEVKSNARSATVAQAVAQLTKYRRSRKNVGLLLVVPYMGDIGAEICEREQINWVDLHGNASVHTDGIRIYIRGKRDVGAGADSYWSAESGVNPFSRKASRITHALLNEPHRAWTRMDLEMATGLDKGYVSKIVMELLECRYLEKASAKRGPAELHVVEPFVLLDAWREKYKPERPIMWGLIAARGGHETTERLAEILSEANIDYAITGLGAAAQYTNFGSYRRVDAYIAGPLPDSAAAELHSGSDDRGRNVAFYLDAFNTSIGVERDKKIRLASPVLAYLDLFHLPERSHEAADELRGYLEQQWK